MENILNLNKRGGWNKHILGGIFQECSLQKLINVIYSDPYSVRMRENTDQNKSQNGHFLSSGPQWSFARKLISVYNLIRAPTLDIMYL